MAAERTEGGLEAVAEIARAVLYEGYLLWPYRRSALKNRRRWTFGGVYPREHSEDDHPDDPWRMRTEALLEGGEETELEVRARFLHVVERAVARWTGGKLEPAEELILGEERHVPWEEATERDVTGGPYPLGALDEPRSVPIRWEEGREREWLADPEGERAGALLRSWEPLRGTLEVSAERLEEHLWRVRAEIRNTTPRKGRSREEALHRTLCSTHTLLRTRGGGFVSLMDPPGRWREPAEACRNDGTWPVLAGEEESREMMLSSPIILYDYPEIAPESPGDLFDGTEIDELLALNILTLTEEEKEEMRATDPRAREILERTESLSAEEMMNLHGTFRELRKIRPGDGRDPRPAGRGRSRPGQGGSERAGSPPGSDGPAAARLGRPGPGGFRPPSRTHRESDRDSDEVPGFWRRMGSPGAASVTVDGVELRKGSRVRLHPDPGGDIFDTALDGRTAVVEGIDEDDRGEVHLSVTIEDDPGRDLGEARHPGHRFFFRPGEVEPLLDPVSEPGARVLVAGVGNVFLGDDGFGVEVARRLGSRSLPTGVDVVDFGIRGMDLAYSLADYGAAILIDATPRGGDPGTLYLIEPDPEEPGDAGVDTHGMDPVRVLALARELGEVPDRIRVVGCEPSEVLHGAHDEDLVDELSGPVRAAVGRAAEMVETLAREFAAGGEGAGSNGGAARTRPTTRGRERGRVHGDREKEGR